MECPHCKLINPPGAILCDCGYDFERRVRTRSNPVVRISPLSFLPAALAAATDLIAASIVRANQGEIPGRFAAFMAIMFGAALLVAIPSRRVRFPAILAMIGGMILGIMSVGWFYVPTD